MVAAPLAVAWTVDRGGATCAMHFRRAVLWTRYGARRGDTSPMGYDPYRKHSTTRLDYVLLAAAAFIAIGLVVWALLG